MSSFAILLSVHVAALGADMTVSGQLSLTEQDAQRFLPSPMPARVTLSAEKPSQVTRPPADVTLWGEIPFGPGSTPKPVAVAVCGEASPAGAKLVVDANGNGDLTDDPPADWKQIDPENKESSRWEGGFTLPIGGVQARILAYRYLAEPSKVRGLDPNLLFYYRDYAPRGTLDLGGKPTTVMLADETTSGDFTHPGGRGKLQIGFDTNRDGGISSVEWFDLARPVPMFGLQILAKSISADGRAVELSSVEPGTRPAIPFAGPTLDGATIKFPDEFKGKLVLVPFWATWCSYCRKEMPTILAAHNRNAGDDFAVLGVSLDKPNGREALKTYIAENKVPWTNIYDAKGFESEIARQYGVKSIPTLFLVDADTGMVVAEGQAVRGAQLGPTVANALAKRRGKSVK